jgi:serine/threonine protein phosphatase PrpC
MILMRLTKRPQKQSKEDLEKRYELPQVGLDQPVPFELEFRTAQSIGMERTHNEDALFALRLTSQNSDTPLKAGIFMVADGMGGHLNGQLASTCAIQTASACLFQDVTELLKDNPGTQGVAGMLQKAVDAAQTEVLDKVPGGGTTLTVALILHNQLTFAHVGDSRLYLFQDDGKMTLLTHDHSLVKRLVDLGQISPAEASVHPQRNVLFRALGQTEAFKVDIDSMPLSNPCLLMLCSDGLWGQVTDEQILEILRQHQFDVDACENLVEAANQLGGSDNISVILVKIS